jgi:hypothetical protein
MAEAKTSHRGAVMAVRKTPERLSRPPVRAIALAIWLLAVGWLLAGCRSGTAELPTLVAAATLAGDQPAGPVPPTWTPVAGAALVSPTPAGLPSRTPRPGPGALPTRTAIPTMTHTPSPTPTETATPTIEPTALPAPSGANLLPNPSFEQGWHHQGGVTELQVPSQWTLEWDEGDNPLDPDPWNRYVRPESRVLNGDFLPPHEHDLFIWDGDYTVKIFKGEGALSYRLVTNVFLQPGSYLFEVNIFPDLVVGYNPDGSKIWAPDPLSGEVRFIVDGPAGNWTLPVFGQKNTFRHAFQIEAAQMIRIGLAVRGRWAILNNGWFMDDWSLSQLSVGGD